MSIPQTAQRRISWTKINLPDHANPDAKFQLFPRPHPGRILPRFVWPPTFSDTPGLMYFRACRCARTMLRFIVVMRSSPSSIRGMTSPPGSIPKALRNAAGTTTLPLSFTLIRVFQHGNSSWLWQYCIEMSYLDQYVISAANWHEWQSLRRTISPGTHRHARTGKSAAPANICG